MVVVKVGVIDVDAGLCGSSSAEGITWSGMGTLV
jgi:hypothetical protein